ncbi:MAG: glycosyltransferase family 4 protein [Candidatus Pacebacteria bacterium]|jgi:glycosyltransferase involved in cell wall biosynthesis|nr:glycosyltransferase family 4 protein [Candidatus Paceibacterota bacterium]MBT4004742.1 glycosyltransferase family 4 protein [Candidatus Paceibacterota bacterium]MBT6899267.1 glycosyltransferase family 4 protein [Candidatus Paceibacterota bacterium]MBT7184167.1 glycosyltransferase family 4 protein [Candidatus Paceibacterota bacterium]MBT7310001.1 glycosyltransferase family 4 protein [Candidatus Paceibacterota bacterium]
MKIIFSTYEAKEIGGSYLRSLSLADGLTKLGHEVTLWTSAKEASLIPKISFEKKVRIIESIGLLPYRFRKGGYDPFDIVFRSLAILVHNCDVIHTFNHRPAASVPGLIKSFFDKKTKWFLDWADLWGRGGIADRRYGRFSWIPINLDHYTEQFFIKYAQNITPISDDLVKKAIKIRGSKNKIFFLPIGANVDGIKPLLKDKSRKKLRLPLEDKILVYLWVGTYDEILLAKTFIALSRIRKDVRLLLLGPKNINEFYKEFKNQPSFLKKVIHPGIVSRKLLPYYLAAGDVMLIPFANKEINLGKFPNKLGDYLAAGRPIAANPTGEVGKLLTKEKVGILAPEDPKEFAQAISELLNSSKKMKAFGNNSRKIAESLSWRSVAQQLEGLYVK